MSSIGIFISIYFNIFPLLIIPFCLASLILILIAGKLENRSYLHYLFLLILFLFVLVFLKNFQNITPIGLLILITISLMGKTIKSYGGIIFEKIIWKTKFIKNSWEKTSKKSFK